MRFLGSKFTQNALAARAPPRTPLAELKRSPIPLGKTVDQLQPLLRWTEKRWWTFIHKLRRCRRERWHTPLKYRRVFGQLSTVIRQVALLRSEFESQKLSMQSDFRRPAAWGWALPNISTSICPPPFPTYHCHSSRIRFSCFFFKILKNRHFLRFFEVSCQKNVKK